MLINNYYAWVYSESDDAFQTFLLMLVYSYICKTQPDINVLNLFLHWSINKFIMKVMLHYVTIYCWCCFQLYVSTQSKFDFNPTMMNRWKNVPCPTPCHLPMSNTILDNGRLCSNSPITITCNIDYNNCKLPLQHHCLWTRSWKWVNHTVIPACYNNSGA